MKLRKLFLIASTALSLNALADDVANVSFILGQKILKSRTGEIQSINLLSKTQSGTANAPSITSKYIFVEKYCSYVFLIKENCLQKSAVLSCDKRALASSTFSCKPEITNVVWGPQSNTPYNKGKAETNVLLHDNVCGTWTTVECDGSFMTNKGMCELGLKYSTDYKEFTCPKVINNVVWGPQSNTPYNKGKAETNVVLSGDKCGTWTTVECDGTYPTNKGQCAPGLRYSVNYTEHKCYQVGNRNAP